MVTAVMTALGRPFARVKPEQRKQVGLLLLTVLVLIFPFIHDDDADIDSLANAAAYATLALGLNIVVGFAGLLDLGYAAFFAIGAYLYGVLTAFQVMPVWSGFWDPLAAVGLVEKINQGGPDLVH
jgi:branched-chain amino acid transport system permease protein